MLPILENVNNSIKENHKIQKQQKRHQHQTSCTFKEKYKYESRGRTAKTNEQVNVELCSYSRSVAKAEDKKELTSDSCREPKTTLLQNSKLEQDLETEPRKSSYADESFKNPVPSVREYHDKHKFVSSEKDSQRRKENLYYNGDICNCSSSMDDDSSLQSSPTSSTTKTRSRTKKQSNQTEFDRFLDKDEQEISTKSPDRHKFNTSLRVRNQRKHSVEEYNSSTVPHPDRNSHPNKNIYFEGETSFDDKNSDIMLLSPTFPRDQLSSHDQEPNNKKEGLESECECSKTAKSSTLCNDDIIEHVNPISETIIDIKSEMLQSPQKDSSKIKTPKITICDNTTPEKKLEKKKPLIKRPSSMQSTEMSSILKEANNGPGDNVSVSGTTLAKLNKAPPKDQQKLVADMRRTLGPNFATMGLIMAARSQIDVWNTQVGVLDPEANLDAQENPDEQSYFFQEIYTPFMEVLIKGNSGVAKINDHARTVPPCERCFFCLLILVTFIYGVGILTAVILLASMMLYT